MPPITPFMQSIAQVAQHAMSQGYVKFVAVPTQVGTITTSFTDLDDMTIDAELDQKSDVLQLFRVSVGLVPFSGVGVQFRLLRGSDMSEIVGMVTRNLTPAINNGSVTMFWTWADLPPGHHTLKVQTATITGSGGFEIFNELLHVLVVMKRVSS